MSDLVNNIPFYLKILSMDWIYFNMLSADKEIHEKGKIYDANIFT